MTTTDYLINIVLIALVLLQVRQNRLGWSNLLRPVILVTAAALYYLHGVPTAGHDLNLDLALGGLGLALGVTCAAATRVWRGEDGHAYSQAGRIAAVLWVVGIGSRLAFEEFSTHGGAHHIVAFSVAHQISGQNAWIAALVIMALTEVLSRMVVIRVRAHLASDNAATVSSQPASVAACGPANADPGVM